MDLLSHLTWFFIYIPRSHVTIVHFGGSGHLSFVQRSLTRHARHLGAAQIWKTAKPTQQPSRNWGWGHFAWPLRLQKHTPSRSKWPTNSIVLQETKETAGYWEELRNRKLHVLSNTNHLHWAQHKQWQVQGQDLVASKTHRLRCLRHEKGLKPVSLNFWWWFICCGVTKICIRNITKHSEGYYLVSNISIGRWFHGSTVWIQPSIGTESTNSDSIEIQEYIKVMKETTNKRYGKQIWWHFQTSWWKRFALCKITWVFSNIRFRSPKGFLKGENFTLTCCSTIKQKQSEQPSLASTNHPWLQPTIPWLQPFCQKKTSEKSR